MKAPDVNVLVHAFREESPHHTRAASWVRGAMSGSEPIGLAALVLHGYLRIVTNRRVYPDPTPIGTALDQVEGMLARSVVAILEPGPRHWHIFSRLCRDAEVRGNLITDAALAAVAIEHGATWVTLDRDFARFPGLRWELPPEVS